jgi:hypothetical protein
VGDSYRFNDTTIASVIAMIDITMSISPSRNRNPRPKNQHNKQVSAKETTTSKNAISIGVLALRGAFLQSVRKSIFYCNKSVLLQRSNVR